MTKQPQVSSLKPSSLNRRFEAILSRAMAAMNLAIARRNPRGTVPGGEAEVADRGWKAVDRGEIARFTKVFSAIAEHLVQHPLIFG